MAALSVTAVCSARELSVRSTKRFDRVLNKKSFALVFFYQLDKGAKKNDPRLYDSVMGLTSMVHRLGMRHLYREGDLQIIKVNLSKDDLQALAEDYGLKKIPAFILFKNGLVIQQAPKEIAVLYGFVNAQELSDFIDSYLKKSLEERVQEKAEEREYRRAMNNFYLGVGYGYSYPAYYGPYWGGPYWGYGPGYGAGFWF